MEKQLPKNWVLLPFTEIFDINGGTQPPKAVFIDEPKVGYIRLLQIRDFGKKPVPTYIPDTGKLMTCKKDDILIARYGASIGRIVTGMEGSYNVALAKVSVPENMNKNFVKWLLKSNLFQEPILSIQRTAQNGFNKTDLASIYVPLPPLAEQNRIVDKLDRLFAQLETIKTSMANIPLLLKDFRQQVLTQAVTGKLTEEWRKGKIFDGKKLLQNVLQEKRELLVKIKTNKLEQYKYSENLFPESWAFGTPGEIASTDRYALSIGPFGSNLKVEDYRDSGVPLVFVRHIRAGNFDELSPKFVSVEKAAELEAHSVEGLDLLITKMGEPPGECELYPEILPKAIITADCLKFRVWDKYFNRLFYKYAINSSFVKEQLGLITFGVAQQKISLERFRSIKLPVPSFEEQQEIVHRVESLFTKADAIEQQYKALKAKINTLPQALLHKAFKGELTEQLDSDGDARELLEEIKALKAATGKVIKSKTTKNTAKKVKPYSETDEVLRMVAEEHYKK